MTKYTSKMDLTKEIKEEYQPGGSQRQYILDKAVEYIRDVPGLQQAKHYFCTNNLIVLSMFSTLDSIIDSNCECW